MKELLSWTLEALRSDSAMMSWLEERRYEWTPLVNSVISNIMQGYSIILMTDNNREWLVDYIISKINNSENNRPFFPIYSIKSIFP